MVDKEQLRLQLEDLQQQLQDDLLDDASVELNTKPSLRSAPDYQKIKALAAVFELQSYLPNIK